MAIQLIHDFVRELSGIVEFPEPIVEFGSLQVEAEQPHDLRPLFKGRNFIGTDMRAGPGVDRVEDLRNLRFSNGEVGTAICLDTLEHCADPVAACREMHRVLRENGLLVISSVMLCGIHGYPNDYFRFTPEGFRSMLEPFDSKWAAGIGDPEIPFQVVGVGRKHGPLDVSLESFPSLEAAQHKWASAEGEVKLGPFRVPLREMASILAAEVPRAVRDRVRARLRR